MMLGTTATLALLLSFVLAIAPASSVAVEAPAVGVILALLAFWCLVRCAAATAPPMGMTGASGTTDTTGMPHSVGGHPGAGAYVPPPTNAPPPTFPAATHHAF
ncbi:hypothetical protein AURDEDRAFT_161579 [Auricularia subglabra TFB-10046 SS5]|nr:hypothetical protein AURDEDRAFT_161579 [Auricularia subglabra TFB-10046 SS5]